MLLAVTVTVIMRTGNVSHQMPVRANKLRTGGVWSKFTLYFQGENKYSIIYW
jgi:hypothetical protein